MSSRELPDATWDDLFREVIEPGYCYACGGCSSICPVYVIEFQEATHPTLSGVWPTLVGECIDCGACLQACPCYWDRVHGENDDKKYIGNFHETADKKPTIYLAYAADEEVRKAGQSGGVVSAILIAAQQVNLIDAGMVLVEKEGRTELASVAATGPSEFIRGAGSKFTSYPGVEGILQMRSVWDESGSSVFVGVPCMIKSMNMMQLVRTDRLDRTCTTIGLLCTTIFHPEKLQTFLLDREINFDNDVAQIAIRSGVLRLKMNDGSSKEMPIRDADEAAAREGCTYCLDFAAETADLAVGEIGVPDGTSFIFVRTQRGRDLIEIALQQKALVLKEFPEEAMKSILRVNRYKKKRKAPPPLKPFPGPLWRPLRKELESSEN
ncbi:MAG: Coenzyme F420 hydrogenase/dehydrogenase, beta subunit C-terminal domain [Candidatus Hodarchaeales archaeon]|jgi:coenzyme F420-reducing hydrogenase beta subunit